MNHDLSGQDSVAAIVGISSTSVDLCDRSVGFHAGDSVVFDGGCTIF